MKSYFWVFAIALLSSACGSNPQVGNNDDEGPQPELDGGPTGPVLPIDENLDEEIVVTDDDDEPIDPCDLDGGCEPLPIDAGPACGNGRVEPTEVCDDGNSVPGDGCTGTCKVEPNYTCPPAGGACQSTIECGNGQVEGSEVCDDGNSDGGDGCSEDCLSKDPNYDCSVAGQLCVNLVVCGNGILEGAEPCDDGNTEADDGCAADCMTIEEGYRCLRPGEECSLEPRCGDGAVTRGEQCDDSNDEPGDGCSESCEVEEGYFCAGSALSCVQEVCGDGVRTPSEQCDDGNDTSGDGCTACEVDGGFVCPSAGDDCIPRCGDGVPNGYEECDDGNQVAGDGCGAGCLREMGYVCPNEGGGCVASICGDGHAQGDEGCDDENFNAGDGCGPTCQLEPTFDASGVANVSCGDGLITSGETCDDGNPNAGDGCSDTCQIEEGWNCTEFVDYPESVDIAVTYRDFLGAPNAGGHPDFENTCGDGLPDDGVCAGADGLGIAGAACTVANAETCGSLDDERKPVRGAGFSDTIISANSYSQWFRDDADADDNLEVVSLGDALSLTRVGDATSDVYEFESDAFFPLNERGHGNTCGNETIDDSQAGCCQAGGTCLNRNYHFTTELRYFFQYQGGETLTFRGDDDVWVFINGKLAVDVGGVHCVQYGRVVLGDEDGTCSEHRLDTVTTGNDACVNAGVLADCTASDEELADVTDDRFGITKGGVYEIVLFHAERHTVESNFRLTLQGFLPPRSTCSPICGDGLVQRGEVCDDGEDNVTEEEATYGACVECRSRTFCGDGVQDGPEACDNGLNISSYATGGDACAPGCVLPPDCGDGELQPAHEDCDLGAELNTGAYDGCTMTCDWGPFCGDGNVDEDFDEVCDAGNLNGGYGRPCGYDCMPAPRCGDGLRNGPEQCDDGDEQNGGEYGGCQMDCTLAPRCGDSQVQREEGEQCDDGVNDGGYGECAPECQLGPRCGDSQVQREEGEQCDDGANDGGYGECAAGCRLGPRCGDDVVQQEAGEQCDDGPNGSKACSKTCKNLLGTSR